VAVQIMTISVQPDVRERLRAEAEATGLKMTTIIQQALAARWEAQDKTA
jgi:predicted transcriptional regulator